MELTAKKTFSRVGLCFFVLMLLTQILQATSAALVGIGAPHLMQADWYLWVVSYAPLYCIAFPVFLWMMHFIPSSDVPEKETMPMKKWLRYFLFGMGATYLLNIVSTLINLGIGFLKGAPVINPLASMQLGSGLIYNFIFGCLVAPIGEEFIFRKLLHDKIGRFGEKAFVLTGGFLFALFHANLSQLLYAFVLGAMFCYIYAKTGKLIYTITLHIAINTFGFLIMPLAVGSKIGQGIASVVVFALIAYAIVLFLRTRGTVWYAQGTEDLPARPVKTVLWNAGMISYAALCAILIVIIILA